jgi:hypothetical protein
MAKILSIGMTHEGYFDKYCLSVEQYGEILVKVAFRGTKMPDNYKGFDIEAMIKRKPARIEVKSKIANSSNSKPSVIHCNDNKVGSNGMTHFVVILINRKANGKRSESSVQQALLLSKERAESLRRTKTKSKYINVRELKKEANKKLTDIKDITDELRKVAQSFV